MKIKNLLTQFALITLTAGAVLSYAPHAQAASVSAHVRIVGTERTIWYGDVTTEGCTITDEADVQHTFTTPVGICVLDAAAKQGDFPYIVKDFGGPLGLFVKGIAEDIGDDALSTFWLYDVNGEPATEGIASYDVNNGDSIYLHFDNPAADPNKRAINDGLTYLWTQQDTTGKIAGFNGISSWATMSYAAHNINPAAVSNGGSSLLQYLGGNPPATTAAATEWERDLLAVTAAGQNPFTFGGTNYVTKLQSFHNNNQLGVTTQVNDDMFGLLALLSAGSGASTPIKQDSLNFILANQKADGGFSWSTTGVTGVDDTAAALQALVAAQKAGMTAPNLATAITNAKNFILSAKNTDGGFPYLKGEASNASTTAWALMALSALGTTGADVDGAKAYLRGAQGENGSFSWQSGFDGDTFTTAYAVHALTGKYWPVKVFTGTPPTGSPTPTPTSAPTNTPTPTRTPTPTSTPKPTSTPTPTVTATPSPTMVSPTVTSVPSATPTATPTVEPDGEEGPVLTLREQMRQFRKEYRAFWKKWRENFRKSLWAYKHGLRQ